MTVSQGTRGGSGDVVIAGPDAWADLAPPGHVRGANRIAETSASTTAAPAVDAPKPRFKIDPITAAVGGTALAAAAKGIAPGRGDEFSSEHHIGSDVQIWKGEY